jgi:hypothetical protein
MYRYSSSVSVKGAVQAYDMVVVAPAFFDGSTWTSRSNYNDPQADERLLGLQNMAINGQIWDRDLWTNLSWTECQEYKVFESDRGGVLLVTADIDSAPFPRKESQRASPALHHESTILEHYYSLPRQQHGSMKYLAQ